MGERKSNKKKNVKLRKEKENQKEIGLKFRQKKEVKIISLRRIKNA
jgi:hypothetical protein